MKDFVLSKPGVAVCIVNTGSEVVFDISLPRHSTTVHLDHSGCENWRDPATDLIVC